MLKATLQIAALVAGMGALLFGAAGRVDWPAGWSFLLVFAAFALASLRLVDPDLVRERGRLPSDAKRWDLFLAPLGFVFLYPGTVVFSGLDLRLGGSPPLPEALETFALAVFGAGYAFGLWAMRCNRFFSTFVRIQRERGQTVVAGGPYAYVRHPGYGGAIVAHLAIPIALGSLWGLLPALVGALLFVARTAREDRTLREELPGYREYAARVPWRLLPRVW